MASIDAELAMIYVMATCDPLSQDQRVAIQLSHNAIAGEDDPAVLKQLYESLSIDWRQYSGLDDKTLKLLKDASSESLGELNLEFATLSFVFLPDELTRVRAMMERVKEQTKGSDVWLARQHEYDRLLDAMDDVSAAYSVKNAATTLMIILDVVERHLGDLSAGWDGDDHQKHKNFVPLSTVLGNGRVPAAIAQKLKKRLDKLIQSGEVEQAKPWRVLEKLLE